MRITAAPKAIAAACLFFVLSPQNVLAADEVDLADLAAFDNAALGALIDEDHNLALSQIRHAGAVQEKKAAETTVKEARAEIKRKEADYKAARAELDAAKKNEVPDRILRADAQTQKTKRSHEAAKAFLKWKEQEVKIRDAEIKMGRALVALRQAEREYARADMVVNSHGEAAAKYSLGKFMAAVQKGTREEAKAREKVEKETLKAKQIQDKWVQLSADAGSN